MCYSKIIKFGTKTTEVKKDNNSLQILYEGVKVGESFKIRSDMNVIVFKTLEDNKLVTYDVAVMTSSGPEGDTSLTYCFLGREGQLIFSDAPGFKTNKNQ